MEELDSSCSISSAGCDHDCEETRRCVAHLRCDLQSESLESQLMVLDTLVTEHKCPTCFAMIENLASRHKNDLMIQFALARALRFGFGGEKDKPRAEAVLLKMLDDPQMQSLPGLQNVVMFYCATLSEKKDPLRMVELCERVIQADSIMSVHAMDLLGNWYIGAGEVDPGLQLLVAAVTGGSELAAFNLGHFYDTVEDFPEAMRWFQRCADMGGGIIAYNCLGEYHELGQGVPRSLQMAIHYYEKAMEEGATDYLARLSAARIELEGHPETPEQIGNARRLFELALEAGDSEALLFLAQMAADEGDIDKAEALLTRSAQETGDIDSYALLGELFSKFGRDEDALQMFRKAASLGSGEGAFLLGCSLLERGLAHQAALAFSEGREQQGHQECSEALYILMQERRQHVQPARFRPEWHSCFRWYLPETRDSVRQWLCVSSWHPLWSQLPLELVYQVIEQLCFSAPHSNPSTWVEIAEALRDLLMESFSDGDEEFSSDFEEDSEEMLVDFD